MNQTITSKIRLPFHSIHCGSVSCLSFEKSKVTRPFRVAAASCVEVFSHVASVLEVDSGRRVILRQR